VKQASILLLGLFAVLWTRPASAVLVLEDKEKGIAVNVGALIQPWFLVTTPASDGAGPGACGTATRPRCSPGIGNPDGDGPSFDFFLRRARLMLWGTVTKDLAFFIDTDEPNLGRNGNFATTTIVQDAFFSYTFVPELKLDAGLMLVPLSHHTLEGATSLNALDYHADTIRFPTGRIFRDVGVQLRGLVFDERIHYRIGAFEGVRNAAVPAPAAPPPAPPEPLNNKGIPRFTAHLRGNILGSEPDFFLKGIYFSPTPILSVGVGADYQPHSVYELDGERGNYLAFSADLFAEYPFSADDELIVKANFFDYAEGTSTIGASNLPAGGVTYYAEAGFRHAWIEPIVFYEGVKAREQSLTILAPHAGVNFWFIKHNFNLKTDVGYREARRSGLPPTKDLSWTTQGQAFF
jgi:hypothetical protein